MLEGQLERAHPHRTDFAEHLGKLRGEAKGTETHGSAKIPFLVDLVRRLRENDTMFRIMTGSFRTLQKIGFNLSPNHFYFPIPDISELTSRPWPVHALPAGFDLNLERQLAFLNTCVSRYGNEISFAPGATNAAFGYHYSNGFFEAVDAEIAYCFVRESKPSRVVEIGSGFSSCVLAHALQLNWERDGVRGDLTSIDPFPSPMLPKQFHRIRLLPNRIQDVDLEEFTSLKAGDILFIDSSHVVSTGNDVIREYLEILPRLQSGVIVHIHDIFLPADYPRKMVVENLVFWSEQYLLQAFLTFNPAFEVLWGSSAMQIFHPEALEAAFPAWKQSYRVMPANGRRFIPTVDGERVWPSSFWMRRV